MILKRTLCIGVATAFLGLAACSKSSDSGGAAPVKPNLQPLVEVAESFTVIQQAGPQTQTNTGLYTQFAAAASVKPNKDIRTQGLKRLIANPNQCKVAFRDKDQNAPAGTVFFSLNINGPSCPLAASFNMSLVNQGLKSSSNVNYIYKVTNIDAQKLVGATAGKLTGSTSAEASQDDSGAMTQKGTGTFTGSVDSLAYGHVDISMNFSADVKVTMPPTQKPPSSGSDNGSSCVCGPSGCSCLQAASTVEGLQVNGSVVEATTFSFADASVNVSLLKTTTYAGQVVSITYTANGVAISEAEYNEVMGNIQPPESNSQSENSGQH